VRGVWSAFSATANNPRTCAFPLVSGRLPRPRHPSSSRSNAIATVALTPMPLAPQEALGELVGSAKEGLLALSVGVGLGVLAELLEEEVVEVVGPKGKHDPERSAVRHGHEAGEVTLGGRRVQLERPRVRSADGATEVRLYDDDFCTRHGPPRPDEAGGPPPQVLRATGQPPNAPRGTCVAEWCGNPGACYESNGPCTVAEWDPGESRLGVPSVARGCPQRWQRISPQHRRRSATGRARDSRHPSVMDACA
jgi:hypothetical protein